mgnify:CR=1 FL=1
MLEGVVTVALALNLKYGYSIMDVSAKVQEKVKASIENMTGLTVADVNIRVAGVDMETRSVKTEWESEWSFSSTLFGCQEGITCSIIINNAKNRKSKNKEVEK